MSEISWARRFYWSVRREWWENPAIWAAPLAAGVLVVLGFLVAAIRIGANASAQQSVLLATLIKQPYDFASGLIMAGSYIAAIFYCLDTLYAERRDRSILLWKSLPVSDVTTVMAKLTIPLVIVPLVGWAVSTVAFTLMTLEGSAVFALMGVHAGAGAHPPLLRTSMLLLYHLFTVHSLWWAPFFGWLILISAWSRRTPFVWAVVPMFAVVMLEHIALNTSYFQALLSTRFTGSPLEAVVAKGTMPIDPMTRVTPWLFLSNPSLWIGFAIAAVFVMAAVRLRRDRGPI